MSLQDTNEVGHAGAIAAIADVPRAAAAVWMRALPDPAKKIDYQAHAMQMKRRCKPHRQQRLHSRIAINAPEPGMFRASRDLLALRHSAFALGLRLFRTTRDPREPAKDARSDVMFCRNAPEFSRAPHVRLIRASRSGDR